MNTNESNKIVADVVDYMVAYFDNVMRNVSKGIVNPNFNNLAMAHLNDVTVHKFTDIVTSDEFANIVKEQIATCEKLNDNVDRPGVNMTDVYISLSDGATLPEYATPSSSGVDLRANLNIYDSDAFKAVCNKAGFPYIVNTHGAVCIPPMGRVLIPTGINIALSPFTEAQVRPRSGLAIKAGITLVNSPGTIDEDYRGDIGIIIQNTSDVNFYVKHGDRIAQLVVVPVLKANWIQVNHHTDLPKSLRGADGFGSSGI